MEVNRTLSLLTLHRCGIRRETNLELQKALKSKPQLSWEEQKQHVKEALGHVQWLKASLDQLKFPWRMDQDASATNTNTSSLLDRIKSAHKQMSLTKMALASADGTDDDDSSLGSSHSSPDKPLPSWVSLCSKTRTDSTGNLLDNLLHLTKKEICSWDQEWIEHTGGLLLLYLERLERVASDSHRCCVDGDAKLEGIKRSLQEMIHTPALKVFRNKISQVQAFHDRAVLALATARDTQTNAELRLATARKSLKSTQELLASVTSKEGLEASVEYQTLATRLEMEEEGLAHAIAQAEVAQAECQDAQEEHIRARDHLATSRDSYRTLRKDMEGKAAQLKDQAIQVLAQKLVHSSRYRRLTGLYASTKMVLGQLEAALHETMETIDWRNTVPVHSGHRRFDYMVRDAIR